MNAPPESQLTHSADGTPIAWSVEGGGPALVVVNCAMAWRRSTPQPQLPAALAQHFTVITYDRRGKGESGTTDPYAVDRECEDLAAVIGAAGVNASVYGFSSGALLALTAAARRVPMTKVVASEPPVGGRTFRTAAQSSPRFWPTTLVLPTSSSWLTCKASRPTS
jgi:pimeloyl-ACP methyl ester carboxylesterase